MSGFGDVDRIRSANLVNVTEFFGFCQSLAFGENLEFVKPGR